MNREYYYLEGIEQKGPLGIDQLKSVGLLPETLVWTEGMSDWKPAKEVDELIILFKTPPPPSPPPLPPLKEGTMGLSNDNSHLEEKPKPQEKKEVKTEEDENITEEDDDSKHDTIGKIVLFVLIGVICWALFFFGSWSFVIGEPYEQYVEKIKLGDVVYEELPGFVLEEDMVLVRVGKKFHGLETDGRFFDIPVLQWIMLGLSILLVCTMFYLLKAAIFGDDD